jgi:hypothetical protein
MPLYGPLPVLTVSVVTSAHVGSSTAASTEGYAVPEERE